MNKNGFTLVEVIIAIGITAVLSSLAIVYSHIGQNQITLSIEESKIGELILQAKELSVATYGASDITCAYGVQFDFVNSTYSLFAYNAATSSASVARLICPSIASTSVAFDTDAVQPYADGSWQVHVAPGVAIHAGTAASDTIQDILFYPPDPCTMISLDGQTFQSNCTNINNNPPAEAYVYLTTADGNTARTIAVSPAGQVSL
jgi:prepilin-type N-terminal cleavage/methylation domain-containing protein